MKHSARARTRWLLVVVFAIGMAWVEAASVYYLRVMVDRLDPYQANPLPTAFNWSGFVVTLALMAAPVAHILGECGP